MKKYVAIAAMSMALTTVFAQETYENAKLASQDLNGTARYVGMGGAMEALGADISTIGTNPAGIGLFRKSSLGLSMGVVSQQGGNDVVSGDKTHVSFDQIGFVYSTRSGRNSFLNFGFNYHKSKNFDYILSAAGGLQDASQNKLSYLKGARGSADNGGFNVGKNREGEILGYVDDRSSFIANPFNQLDYLYWNALLVDPQTDAYGYNTATGYVFDRVHTGYIGSYDFNLSGNIQDIVYLGMTLGIEDVHYRGNSQYIENLVDGNGAKVGSVRIADNRRVKGTGYNVKAGIIVRPIEESPFRLGAYISTPTWYELTTKNTTEIYNNTDGLGAYDKGYHEDSYDFKLNTPWKFGLSLGHTVGNYLALGASYEYADYSALDSRIIDDTYGYYDYYGNYTEYTTSSSDRVMNNHTERTLKGVSTLKLGIEYKPVSSLSLRAGYNYVTSMYEDAGYKDGSLNSPGSNVSSATDYTNWKNTNRYTLGIGHTSKKFNIDLAYQYSATNGDFYPFMKDFSTTYEANNGQVVTESNSCQAVRVSNKRHQVLLTLGYRF